MFRFQISKEKYNKNVTDLQEDGRGLDTTKEQDK